jgi:hypothetical protein
MDEQVAIAALYWALVVSVPFVSSSGPVPEVFGLGRFTPCARMHETKFTNACLWAVTLVVDFGTATPGLSSAQLCTASKIRVREDPLGRCLTSSATEDTVSGTWSPVFRTHARNRAAWLTAACGDLDFVEGVAAFEPLVAVEAAVDVVEELPQAPSARLPSTSSSAAMATVRAGVRVV